ncbi:MAG: response regulator, partial [bacterium]
AKALLFCEEYERQKRIYAQGMAEFAMVLENMAQASLNAEKQKSLLTIVIAVLAFALFLGAWLVVMRNLTTWRKTLSRVVDERKQSEEQLRKTARELESQKYALDQHSIVAITDRDGRITYVNDKFCQVSQYTRDELIGRNHRILNSGYHPRSFFREMWETISQGRVWQAEIKNRKKDGSSYWLDTTIVPFFDETGTLYQYIVLRTDVTERKRAEKELADSNKFLEKALRDTRELAAVAEAANVAKSEFLANMSHEIRTPMNGVIGMAGLLLETELTEEQRQYAEIVRNSAEALLTVINDILDFSKVEAGKLELESLNFNLHSMLEDVADLIAFKAENNGLTLTCFLPPEIESFVIGDPGRLRQILINLANNAIKFTNEGEVAIRGELQHGTQAEMCVRFTVADTGIGIPETAQRRLFESFSQVDASTTRKFGGTGLGLAISKQLVELMGGEIGVESQPGKGSTFWFTVKLQKQPLETRSRSQPDIDLSGKRMLVVDDNTTNRDILRRQLQARNCLVKEANSGPAALQLMRQHAENHQPFEIAIIDMQMPGMDGEHLGKAIKDEPMLKETILIMLTSLGQRGDAKRLLEIGFQAYLTKPVKQSDLYRCLNTVLGRHGDSQARGQLVTRHSMAENRVQTSKVLVAEDNIVNQKIALKMLKNMGCRVDCVANGKEAVEAVATIPYDIVFMDCQMPEMDGFEATLAIRAQEKADSHVTIVAMTANAMKGDRERCLQAGMDDYISKPVDKEKLQQVIHAWLKKQKGGAQNLVQVVKEDGQAEPVRKSN